MDEIDRTKRRTLEERLRTANLPTAEQLIGWVFVLKATWLLSLPGATFKGVADRLGFSKPGTLRTTIRRRTGLRARQLLDCGGFDYLLRRFGALLRGDWSQETSEPVMADRGRSG